MAYAHPMLHKKKKRKEKRGNWAKLRICSHYNYNNNNNNNTNTYIGPISILLFSSALKNKKILKKQKY